MGAERGVPRPRLSRPPSRWRITAGCPGVWVRQQELGTFGGVTRSAMCMVEPGWDRNIFRINHYCVMFG
jgi:hypothetical protein